MKILYVSIILLSIVLSGCVAKPTGYVKRDDYGGNRYGYNDKKISDDEYAIIVEGNIFSEPDHVAKLALYHAANVTIRNGKNYFRIVKKSDENLPTNMVTTAIPVPIPGSAILFIPVAETSINETTSILIIQLCEVQENSQSDCLSAENIIDALKPIIEKE